VSSFLTAHEHIIGYSVPWSYCSPFYLNHNATLGVGDTETDMPMVARRCVNITHRNWVNFTGQRATVHLRGMSALLELRGMVEGWTFLAHLSDPQALVNFNPLGGLPQPPSSLLIEYYFVIAVIIYWTSGPPRKWWRLFVIKNLEFCGRGALGLPNPTVQSRRAPSRHNIPAYLDSTAYVARLPAQLFLNNSSTGWVMRCERYLRVFLQTL